MISADNSWERYYTQRISPPPAPIKLAIIPGLTNGPTMHTTTWGVYTYSRIPETRYQSPLKRNISTNPLSSAVVALGEEIGPIWERNPSLPLPTYNEGKVESKSKLEKRTKCTHPLGYLPAILKWGASIITLTYQYNTRLLVNVICTLTRSCVGGEVYA